MVRVIPMIACIITLIACDRSPYPEYRKVGEDIHLRLYMLGDGDRLARDGDSILMRFRISEADSSTGSLFSTENWFAAEDLRNSVFEQLMIRMHEGDSMSLISKAASIPWPVLLLEGTQIEIPKHAMVRTEASMLSIRTAAMMEAEAVRSREGDPQANEQQLIASFIQQLGSNWQQWGTSDLYYSIAGIAVDTNYVKTGDVITISYTGKRIEDGSTFDSSENNGGPLTFRFGDKHQVINGLEIAITLLREGQEGDFFLPSEYAFGERGVEGMIEPFTPVIYTVRLEDVQQKARKSSKVWRQ